MILDNIQIHMFRNIKSAAVEFSNRFNIFYGDNGHGKTNFLEAIFYLGTVKSFRNAKNKDMIAWNQQAATLKSSIKDNGVQHNLFISFNNHGRQIKVDEKNVNKLTDYCNTLALVAFSPDELGMISGAPEQRRRYLDKAIYCSNPEYLNIYYDYFRALKQRNQLLKQHSYAGLEAWTDQLATAGARLITERHKYVETLTELVFKYYKKISGSDEEVRLCYHANSLSDLKDPVHVRNQLCSVLVQSSRLDRERGMTHRGPHRDDLEFVLNGRPIREHGSQGQQKSFVIAMKMAEIEYLEKTRGKSPILLLDDVTAELDSNRTMHLLKFMANKNMQVFMTTTDPAAVPLVREQVCTCFHVENGRLV